MSVVGNILEQEDQLKGLSNDRLLQEMQNPSGLFLAFLPPSEMQRRNEMRERYEANQEQPTNTIVEQIVAEGLGGVGPTGPQDNSSMLPTGMAPQTMGSPIPTDQTFQPLPVVAAAGGPPPLAGGMALGNAGLGGMGGLPQGVFSGGMVGYQGGGFLDNLKDWDTKLGQAHDARQTERLARGKRLSDYSPLDPYSALSNAAYDTGIAGFLQGLTGYESEVQQPTEASSVIGAGSKGPIPKLDQVQLDYLRQKADFEQALETAPPEVREQILQEQQEFEQSYPLDFRMEIDEMIHGPIPSLEENFYGAPVSADELSGGGIVGMSNGGGTAYIDPVTGQRMPILQRFGTSLGAVLNPIESLFETAGGYTDAGFRRMAKPSRIRKIMEENPSLTEEEAEAIYEDMMLRTGRQPLPQFTGPFEREVSELEPVDSPEILSEFVSGADVATTEDEILSAGDLLGEDYGKDLLYGVGVENQQAIKTDRARATRDGDVQEYLDKMDVLTAEGVTAEESIAADYRDRIGRSQQEARADALNSWLMNVGAGVASGDMGAGLEKGAGAIGDIKKESRATTLALEEGIVGSERARRKIAVDALKSMADIDVNFLKLGNEVAREDGLMDRSADDKQIALMNLIGDLMPDSQFMTPAETQTNLMTLYNAVAHIFGLSQVSTTGGGGVGGVGTDPLAAWGEVTKTAN